MTKEDSALIRGLEGVVAAETRLCNLDGAHGRLAYAGYDIDELARLASFEEIAYLLWHGELPRAAQLDALTVQLTAAREIPRDVTQALRLMPRDADPMRALQAAVPLLGMHDPDALDNSHAANVRKAVRLTAQIATVICAHHRIRSGQDPIAPVAGLGHAANFLYMLSGQRPGPAAVKAVHRLRHAYALLDAGLGARAQREALAATQLEPKYALAWKARGWMLQHDAVGRRFGAGYDRAGAIAAYRKARELDPTNTDIAADLGVLLEHDARGERYADKSSLELAVAAYRERATLMQGDSAWLSSSAGRRRHSIDGAGELLLVQVERNGDPLREHAGGTGSCRRPLDAQYTSRR